MHRQVPGQQRLFGRLTRLRAAGRGRRLAGVLAWIKVVAWFNVFVVGLFGFGTVAAVKATSGGVF